MDRWNIVSTLNYLPHDRETDIVHTKAVGYDGAEGRDKITYGSGCRSDAGELH